jgi:hypothetical protein
MPEQAYVYKKLKPNHSTNCSKPCRAAREQNWIINAYLKVNDK